MYPLLMLVCVMFMFRFMFNGQLPERLCCLTVS